MADQSDASSTPPAATELLARHLQYVKGVGPRRMALLQRLNLRTLQDLLFHFPETHKDRATLTPIQRLQPGIDSNILAQIVDVRANQMRSGKVRVQALLQDQSGEIRATWWTPYVVDRLTPNAWGFFSGKLTLRAQPDSDVLFKEFSNSEFEVITEEEPEERPLDARTPALTGPSFGRIVPIYNLRPKQRLPDGQEAPEIKLRQAFLRKLVWEALHAGAARGLTDPLPESLRSACGLLGLAEAVEQIHFPGSFEKAAAARRRLVFEELFILSLGVALRRAQLQRLAAARRLPLTPVIQKRIEARLPFELTAAQKRAFQEIAADMAATQPMNRLLQGDVGSGKTAVAVAALLLSVAHGAQGVLLAPTEVLAEQHARTLHTLLTDSRVKIGLLRGGAPEAARREFLAQLAAGEIHIAVGTHALLEPDVKFKALALIVVDEQHKFGVAQRMSLRAKAHSPHVLVMTATPIPRTLTLTLYGDLDVSRIDEFPPGRGEIVTKFVKQTERPKVYKLMTAEARKGHASYVVLPRIDEETLEELAERPAKEGEAPERLWSEVKGVEAEAGRLREQLPDLRIGLLHGRMAGEEKDRVLDALREGRLDVLVSTQVIEVGIDLPTATIMLIENAEMFGLSALHQLRGRVGRSGRKSYCYVFGTPATKEAKARLKIFVSTRDGFELAEKDFTLRGPGQFFGTAQSGLPELKIADLQRDVTVLNEARGAAFELVGRDAALARPEHALLRQRVAQVLGKRLGLVDVG